MNRVEDPRYDMIYLNPYDDVASGAEKEGTDTKKEEPENKACNVKYYSLKEEEKEGRDCETSGKEVKNIEIDIELDDTVLKINNQITELTKKDGFYHCRYCDDFRDSDISQVWWHERMHTGGKHCCFICDKKFTHRRHLSRHMITHSGERPFQCTDCDKTFTRKEHMDRHRKLHLEGSRRPFQCTECNKTFTRKDHMYEHMKKHREKFEPIVKMDVDDCTIDINTSTSENDRAFSCQYCSYSSSHRSHLESHERTHTGVEDCAEKIYENLECNVNKEEGKEGYDDKVHGEENYDNVGGEHRAAGIEQSEIDIGNFFAFDRKEDLVIHGKIDNDKKRHECPICNKRFTRKDRMKRHVIAHEKKLEKELTSIVKSENIKEERIEEEEEEKKCAEDEGIEVEEQCAEDERIEVEEYTKDVQVEIDTNKYVMIDGNASISNEGFGEFRCRFCDNYSCTLKSDLIAHEKSHDKSREKTFQCEHCQLSFKRVHHLTRHIRVHTGERPFECSICTKAFARKDHLVKHLTVHTGAKPYECSFCHKAFARHYVLSRHEREKHHREESNNTR